MTKNIYIQPSVFVTEMVMTQTLCASPAASTPFSYINPGLSTDEQL